jgi:fructokinase
MNILCFGEILFDVINDKKHLGGAPLNLAAHLALLNNNVYTVSGIGSDRLGQDALERIKNLNIKPDFIQTDKNHQTGLVKVAVDYKGLPSYDIVEDTAYDNITLDNSRLKQISKIPFDCLCFGTLAQRNPISRNSLDTLLKNVKTKQIFCDLNLRANYYSKKIIIDSLMRSNILKINDKEAEFLSDLLYKRKNDFKSLANLLQKDFSLDVIIITCGKNGCLAYSLDTEIKLSGIKTKVIDTVGAGDAFSAGFLSVYLRHQDLEKACVTANKLGAKIAGQSGAIQNPIKTT